jgi:hypothetical protein
MKFGQQAAALSSKRSLMTTKLKDDNHDDVDSKDDLY